MFHPTTVDAATPRAVRTFISQVMDVFRNPMAHAFGFQDPEPPGPLRVTRFPGPGLAEADLETIETSIERPNQTLRGAPTLMRDPATRALSLNVESFYWGVRELLQRLTADAARMAVAETYLGSILRTAK